MEKIWLKNYDPGVPYEIDMGVYSSMVEMAEESFKFYSINTCYMNYGVSLSYQDIDEFSKAIAGFLQTQCDCEKGDRVAVMLPNILQYPVAMFGVLRAGMIVVNINPLYTTRELKVILEDSGAKCVIVLENFAHIVEKALPNTQVKKVIVTKIGDLLGIKGMLFNFGIKCIKKMIHPWNIPNAVPFKSILCSKNKQSFKKVHIESDDVAYLQYTGGTTGGAKGVMLTHRNMVSNLLQVSAWVDSFFKKKYEGGIINALPLYHIFPLTANCLVFLRVGFNNVLITNPKDIHQFVHELKRQPFSVILGVNTMFNKLLSSKEFCDLDFSHLKFSLGGGMAVQRPIAEKWQQVTGIPLIEGYGLTETSPVVSITPISVKKFTANVGLPMPSTEIKVCDDKGNEVPVGEAGELYVRGPQVMKGYWNRPEATKEAITEDGWLKTGDIVSVDNQGYISILDRKNDIIVVSGFNVYPNEVEEVIAEMKGIQEVAVVGIKTKEQGESVKAYIVREDPSIMPDRIIAHCKQFLTGYKIPKFIEFRTELPKSNVGKILRRELRDEANRTK